MRTDWAQRAAELFPDWPAERRARWARARAWVGDDAPRVRVGCGCQCAERGVFAPRSLREAELTTTCAASVMLAAAVDLVVTPP